MVLTVARICPVGRGPMRVIAEFICSKLGQRRQMSGRFFQHGMYALLRQIGELALRLEF